MKCFIDAVKMSIIEKQVLIAYADIAFRNMEVRK